MIKYQLATNNDNQQLINLTAASGMKGDIALRIDRKPDFFKLLHMRGESKVLVAIDNDTIIGSLCVSLQQVYVGGEILPLYYIGDFKVAEGFRNKGVGLQLCNELANEIVPLGADLAFLNVSKGNNKPFSFFKDRPGIPDFQNIGIFHIHQFIGKRRKSFHTPYQIELTAASNEVITFLNRHYSKYELGTVITREKLEGTEVFAIREQGKIVAAMCLIDTMNIKQNVVTKLSWKMKAMLKLLNFAGGAFGLSKMAVLHEPVRMLYIKYLAADDNNRRFVRLLINHGRNIAYEKGYSFVSIGLHEKDLLNHCLSG